MRSEGQRIWSIKIGCATSSINTSSFTLLMILWTILTPLILIWQLTHYDSHTALRQYPTPHRVKSSDQVIFPFLFSHDESLCFILLLIFFLIYHLIHHVVLKRNFLEFSSDSLMSNHLLISEMLLSRSGVPSCIEGGCLASEKGQSSSGYILSSAFISKILSSTVLITASIFVINSHQGLNLSDYIIGVCSYYVISLRRKFSEERSSLKKHIEYNYHCTNIERIVLVLFCVLF